MLIYRAQYHIDNTRGFLEVMFKAENDAEGADIWRLALAALVDMDRGKGRLVKGGTINVHYVTNLDACYNEGETEEGKR